MVKVVLYDGERTFHMDVNATTTIGGLLGQINENDDVNKALGHADGTKYRSLTMAGCTAPAYPAALVLGFAGPDGSEEAFFRPSP